MGEFSLPTNIRQIGSIGDGLRIYMEDYVCTYLHQYAEAGGYDERAAFLVGRHMVIDGQQVLFINGAVQGKEMETRDGLLFFTEKTNEYAESAIKEYFSGMEIVGWMQSQPSYGVYLNQQYGAYHRHVFSRDYQVMFVMDPLERTNSFYCYNTEREAMQEVRGYFIYYDKNKNMHEYMLHDRATDKPAPPSAYVEVFGERSPDDGDDSEEDSRREDLAGRGDPAIRAEELIRKRADDRSRKRSSVAVKRTVNLMTGLSAALFIVCFVMGAGLIQSRDRISSIESQIVQLSTAYRNLFVQLSSDGTSPVFAAEREPEADYTETAPSADGTDVQTEPGTAADDTTGLTEPWAADGAIGLTEPGTADSAIGLTEPGTADSAVGLTELGTADSAVGLSELGTDTAETDGLAETISSQVNAAGLTESTAAQEESTGQAEPAGSAESAAQGETAGITARNESSITESEQANSETGLTGSVDSPPSSKESESAAPGNLPAEVVVDEASDSSVPEAYTIQQGDSLLGISLEYYGNGNMVDDILALNGLADANTIVAGKTIALPRP